MIARLAQRAQPILEFPLVRRTRRNHGLEHATIHVLSARRKTLRMAGRSSDSGFILIGEAPTEQIEEAVKEALTRMKRGEHKLAIHPNCGTNLVTAAFLTTSVGWLGLGTTTRRPLADRFAWTMAGMVLALLAAQPLGMRLQAHFTTKGDPGDLEFVKITRREVRWPLSKDPVTVHRIVTRKG